MADDNEKKRLYTEAEVEALLGHPLPKPAPAPRSKGVPAKKRKIADAPVQTAAAKHRTAAQYKKQIVSVVLTMGHNRNGVMYGPGKVMVPQELAQDLLHNEYHAREIEAQFRGEKAAIIGPRNRTTGAHGVKVVPPETFDSAYEQADPFDTVKGS